MKQQLLLQPCTNPSTPSGYNQILYDFIISIFAQFCYRNIKHAATMWSLPTAHLCDEVRWRLPSSRDLSLGHGEIILYLSIYIYVEHCRIWYCTCLFIVFLWLWSTKKIFPILGFLTTCGQLQNLQVVSVSVEVPNSLRKEPLPQLLDTRSLGCEVQGGFGGSLESICFGNQGT